jgi:aspartyl/asparaginyl-tRNA synthetase
MSANDFFTNAIKYPIKHDDLHEMLIKHSHFKGQLTPTYCKILKDDSEVDVSEDKFNMLSFEEKLNLVQEEVMVMAMERSFHPDYRINYNIMLKKFILNHAPLWEAIFIIFNYPKLIKPFFNYKQFLNNE